MIASISGRLASKAADRVVIETSGGVGYDITVPLGVMEKHLAKRDFLVDDRYSIADIALYAYTHIAHQCDFDLALFPAVRAWLDRVAAQPRYVDMDWHPAARMVAAQ